MTIYTLKQTLHDRKRVLEAGLDQTQRQSASQESLEQEIALAARLAEIKVIFDLVDRIAQCQATLAQERADHPAVYIASRDDLAEPWGAQQREDWPHSTFGGVAIDDPDRYDPNRC